MIAFLFSLWVSGRIAWSSGLPGSPSAWMRHPHWPPRQRWWWSQCSSQLDQPNLRRQWYPPRLLRDVAAGIWGIKGKWQMRYSMMSQRRGEMIECFKPWSYGALKQFDTNTTYSIGSGSQIRSGIDKNMGNHRKAYHARPGVIEHLIVEHHHVLGQGLCQCQHTPLSVVPGVYPNLFVLRTGLMPSKRI